MSRTEGLIKKEIKRLLDERADVLRPAPERGPREYREYPLYVAGRPRPFFADFACRLPDDGWLFIEDDDAKRALSNVAKYWKWTEDNVVGEDVYLIHLIGPGARDLAEFAGRRAEEANPRFWYKVIPVQRWEDPGWRGELARLLDEVTAAGGDGEIAPGSLHDEPFVGMWKDREDMRDSTAWVRELRQRQWTRR